MNIDVDDNSFVFNLDRIQILKDTINEINNNIEFLDEDLKNTIDRLNGKITQIEENPLYNSDEDLQVMKEELIREIEAQKLLYKYKYDSLEKQLSIFMEMYEEVSDKIVVVRNKDLKEELENLTGNKIYSNLSIDVVSSNNSSLNKIVKENKKKDKYMNLTISDKKEPEYNKELNKILYTTKFPIEFDEIEADGFPLYKHISLKYDFSDDGIRYTNLNVANDDNINLKFRLEDLIMVDSDTIKPVELLRDAIYNIKRREIKKQKQKTKRI